MPLVRVAIVFGLGLIIAVGLYNQRFAIACELLDNADFQKIGARVYVDPELSDTEIDELIALLDTAKNRNNNTFGPMVSEPKILITSSAKTAAVYGANQTASIHKSPYGQCIIVGPKGHSVDVFAHELMHAELAHRIGIVATFFRLPTWFDEGVALLVDYRERYDLANINLPDGSIKRVRKLASGAEFYVDDRVVENYQAARLAVAEIFETIDQTSLYDRLERVKQGESFESAFEF